MKAMAQQSWAGGSPLELIELPDPVPRPDELRVRVAAASVNPVDWKMREGGPIRLMARLLGPALPWIPGIDFAGTVDAVGAAVKTVKVGDRVSGGASFARQQRGSYADAVVVREDQICAIPDNVSFETAAATPVCGVTAWMSLTEIGKFGTRGPGEAVLVLGAAGGVGQFTVQLAKMLGARVVAVSSTKNVELVRGLGADVSLDYTAGDVLAEAKKHGPYGVVVDCVGSYAGAKCRAMLAPGGRHVIVSGSRPVDLVQLFVPPFSSKTILAQSTTARLRPIIDGISAGKVRVAIAAKFPLAEAEKAHEMSRSGRTAGKILLVP